MAGDVEGRSDHATHQRDADPKATKEQEFHEAYTLKPVFEDAAETAGRAEDWIRLGEKHVQF